MHAKRRVRFIGLVVLAAVSVMAGNVSAAQAKYLLLFNGASVNLLKFSLEILKVYKILENGLKLECSGGSGSAEAKASESGTKVTGSASLTLKGCIWTGAEKTCTINDGGIGQIKYQANGELIMPDASTYTVTATSAEFGTVYTEGVFCTIPEEEVVSGTMSVSILNALDDAKVKLAHVKADNLKLGVSKVKEMVGEVHIMDADNPNATIGFHLVSL